MKISRQVAILGVILPFYIGQKWVKNFTNRSVELAKDGDDDGETSDSPPVELGVDLKEDQTPDDGEVFQPQLKESLQLSETGRFTSVEPDTTSIEPDTTSIEPDQLLLSLLNLIQLTKSLKHLQHWVN